MNSKTTMKNKTLLGEFLKVSLFSLGSALFIYALQRRYEAQGNQFQLAESNRGHESRSCALYPDTLEGVFYVDTYNIPSFDELKQVIQGLKPGGRFEPSGCEPRENLAVVIPYRDRESNLKLLLRYLHPMLQRQARRYRIVLVEQFGNDVFNKGRIMNIAVRETLKLDPNVECFIFHDVDLIPENDLNVYECYQEPRHLSPAVDELRYNLMYYNLVGGVLALNLHQLNKTNGFSNLYWGWGGEDDDMSMRILDCGYKITRPRNHVGRYKMILHSKRSRAYNRFELLDYWRRYSEDGLNSVDKLNYSVKSIRDEYLYTNITVDIGPFVKESLDKNKIKYSHFRFY